MKRYPMTEPDLAAKVVKFYEANGYEVSQEVQLVQGGPRADIVAKHRESGVLHVVECKLTLSFDLIAQALHWIPYASKVYVAVPKAKASPGRNAAWNALVALSLGAYEVESLWPVDEGRRPAVVEVVQAPDGSTRNPALQRALQPGHQTHAKAGTNRGGHYTRYVQTIEALTAFVAAHPGDSLRACLSQCDHHWSSIAAGIQRLTELSTLGKLQGLRLWTDDEGVVRVTCIESEARGEAT